VDILPRSIEFVVSADMLLQTLECPAMAKDMAFIPNALRPWVEARRRFRLSDAHIQMARELGMNPGKFGGLSNHGQEPWKAPLPVFIEGLYFKRFGKRRPDHVRSIEEIAATQQAKKKVKTASMAVGVKSLPADSAERGGT
jgi:hypothetical protein